MMTQPARPTGLVGERTRAAVGAISAIGDGCSLEGSQKHWAPALAALRHVRIDGCHPLAGRYKIKMELYLQTLITSNNVADI